MPKLISSSSNFCTSLHNTIPTTILPWPANSYSNCMKKEKASNGSRDRLMLGRCWRHCLWCMIKNKMACRGRSLRKWPSCPKISSGGWGLITIAIWMSWKYRTVRNCENGYDDTMWNNSIDISIVGTRDWNNIIRQVNRWHTPRSDFTAPGILQIWPNKPLPMRFTALLLILVWTL